MPLAPLIVSVLAADWPIPWLTVNVPALMFMLLLRTSVIAPL